MPYAIIIMVLIIIIGFLVFFIKKHEILKSRKTSWLYNLEVGDKASIKIPENQLIFGKVTNIAKDKLYYTVEYRVKKDFIHPPFN